MYGIARKAHGRGNRWQMATSALFSDMSRAENRQAWFKIHHPGYDYQIVWLGDLS